MAVCSFIGHEDVYDTNIKSRMQETVNQLVAGHENTEFLIYQGGTFSYIFLLAVLKIRAQYPKKVTITFVSVHDSPHEMLDCDKVYFYMSDRLVMPSVQPSQKNDAALGRRKMLKWVLQNSTHIISYFYGTLYDPNRQTVDGPNTLEISLTTHETETAILEAASHINEKEQVVYRKMNEGCTLREAGNAVGVSGGRARQILQHGCRIIRGELWQRYSRALTADQKQRPACGLFALGESTYESLTRFKLIMDFLISTYNVGDVYVEHKYAHSGFLFALLHASAPILSLHKTHTTALVGGEPLSEDGDDLNAIKASLCPPCHAVGYVSHADSGNCNSDFDVIADMIERTDFCICNLNATPHAEKIRKYAAKTKRTVLLDMSRFNFVQRE